MLYFVIYVILLVYVIYVLYITFRYLKGGLEMKTSVLYLRNFPDTLKKSIKSVAGRKGQTMLNFIIDLARANKEIAEEEKKIISQQKKVK